MSSRPRPDSTATGYSAASDRSASSAPGTRLAAAGSSTMSDRVPSKSKKNAGRRAAHSPAICSNDARASGSADIRRSMSRTVTSARSAITASAPHSRNRAPVAPVRSTPSTRPNPPARAAMTPASASSTTTLRPGRTPRRRAASSMIAGSGLPGRSSSPATTPSTRTPKSSARPADSSTRAQLRLAEMTATCTPASRSRRTSATVDSNTGTPDCTRARNSSCLRFPRPQMVSSSGPSESAPHGSETPREDRKSRTPSSRGLPSMKWR